MSTDIADPSTNSAESWQTVSDKSGRTTDEVTLNDEWTMWFERKDQEKNSLMTETDYLNSLLNVGTFKTLKGFLNKWESVTGTSITGNVHIFKKGIKPIWEDERNINGGKWSITVLKESEEYAEVQQLWLTLVAAVFSEQLGYGNQITGVVLSIRQWGTSFQVWNRDADDEEQQEAVKQKLHKLLKVKKVKYVKHRVSLQKNIEVMFPSYEDKDKKVNKDGQNWKSKQHDRLDVAHLASKFGERRASPDRRISPPRANADVNDKAMRGQDWNALKNEVAAKEAAKQAAEAAKQQAKQEALREIYAAPAKNPWSKPQHVAAPVVAVQPPADVPTIAAASDTVEATKPVKNAWNLKKSTDSAPTTAEPVDTVESVAQPAAPVKNPWAPVEKKSVDFATIIEEEEKQKAAAPVSVRARKNSLPDAALAPTPAPAQEEKSNRKTINTAPVERRARRSSNTPVYENKRNNEHSAPEKKSRRSSNTPIPQWDGKRVIEQVATTTPTATPAPVAATPASAEEKPKASVWDGKRVIEQANIPVPSPPTVVRRKSASEQAGAKPAVRQAPKSQPHNNAPASRSSVAPVELEAIQETAPVQSSPDAWQVVKEVKKVRVKSAVTEDSPAVASAPAPAREAEADVVFDMPAPQAVKVTHAVEQIVPAPAPVAAAAPADDEETTQSNTTQPAVDVPAAPEVKPTQQAPVPSAAGVTTTSAPAVKVKKANKVAKESKTHKRTPSSKSSPSVASTSATAPATATQQEEHDHIPKPFPFQQVAIASGLVLVSIVSYTLFM